MAVYNVSKTGTKTSGASTLDDWSDVDTWNISNLYNCMNAAMSAGTGNEIVFNDDEGNMQRSANINTSFFTGGGTNTLILKGRNDSAVILETTGANVPLFTLDHATDAMTFDIRIPYKRQDGVTAIGSNNYHLIYVNRLVNVHFNGGGCDGNTVVATETTGQTSATVLVVATHTGTITATNHYRKNISITQSRVSSSAAGGISAGFLCLGSSNVTFDSVSMSDITINNDNINVNGMDYIGGSSNFTLLGNILYKDITGTTIGTPGDEIKIRGCLNWMSSGAISMPVTANVHHSNINYSGRGNGPFGFVTTFNYTLLGSFTAENCVTESEENSVGGLFLGITDASTGSVGRLFAYQCRCPFGAVYYVSNGANITVDSAIGYKCSVLNGIFYKGGDGSMSAKLLHSVGGYYNSENPFQPTDNQGSVWYNHMHPDSSDENATANVDMLVMADNDRLLNSPHVDTALITVLSDDVYSIDATIGLLISDPLTPADKLFKIIDNGAGATLAIAKQIDLDVSDNSGQLYLEVAPFINVSL